MVRTIRGICIFLAAVAAIQGLALLLLTPAGLERIHPFFVRVHAESFEPSANTYAVYYDTRTEVAEADLIVIGIDGNVSESYDLLGHFTRFVKQYNNYSAILMDLTTSQRMLSNSLLRQSEESRFDKRLEDMRQSTGMAGDFTGYFKELYIINRTVPEERKFGILSYSEKHLNTGTESYLVLSTEEQAQAAAQTFLETERSAICAVDSRLLEQNTGFREALRAQLPEADILFIQTCYDKACASEETHRISGFPFTFGKDGIYFINNKKSAGFYTYYNKVTAIPGSDRRPENPLDTRLTDYYFMVSGGTLAE